MGDSTFVNKILNNFSRNSYFIVIKVKSEKNVELYLVTNYDLFFYFKQTRGFAEKEYKKYMTLFLFENYSLNITNQQLKKYKFEKFEFDKAVIENSKRGKEYFLRRYFNNYTIKTGVSPAEKLNIIKVLYEWHLPSRIDDESGFLVINE